MLDVATKGEKKEKETAGVRKAGIREEEGRVKRQEERKKKSWLGMGKFELFDEVVSKLLDGSENGVFLWLSVHSVFLCQVSSRVNLFFFTKDVRWVTVLQGHKLVLGC